MNLFACGLVGPEVGQECDELGGGVACSRLAQDLARLGVERGIQGKGAVTDVLKAVTRGVFRRPDQDACLEPIGHFLARTPGVAGEQPRQPIRGKAAGSADRCNCHCSPAWRESWPTSGHRPTAESDGRVELKAEVTECKDQLMAQAQRDGGLL